MKKIISGLLAALLMSGCSSSPTVTSIPVSEGDIEGFYEVLNLRQFDSVFIRSSDALQGYSAAMFADLDLTNLEIDRSRLRANSEKWRFERRDRQRMEEQFAEQLALLFAGKSVHLKQAAGPGTGVLTIEFALTRYKPNAPKDALRDRPIGSTYITEGAGRLYMQARVRDSVSGELLALLEDDRELGQEWEEDNRVNNARRFEQGLGVWLRRLDAAVADLQT
ncbi:DUF3313 family protein [Teredinibacter turnerae]|uniref:DUF3313 family protein n=1 Tax=Teredinibacter turnerae TaxID=2426 RepID=UPI00037D6A00|nr:DUF3313 family protein [Teredinibacter turnerae]